MYTLEETIDTLVSGHYLCTDFPLAKPFPNEEKLRVLALGIYEASQRTHAATGTHYFINKQIAESATKAYLEEACFKDDNKLKFFLIYIYFFALSEIYKYIDYSKYANYDVLPHKGNVENLTFFLHLPNDMETFKALEKKLSYYNTKNCLLKLEIMKNIILVEDKLVCQLTFDKIFTHILGKGFETEIDKFIRDYENALKTYKNKFELIVTTYKEYGKYCLVKRILRNISEREVFEFEDFVSMFDLEYDKYTDYIYPSTWKYCCGDIVMLILNQLVFKKKILYKSNKSN